MGALDFRSGCQWFVRTPKAFLTAALRRVAGIILMFAMSLFSLRAEPPLPASLAPTDRPLNLANADTPFTADGATAYKKLSLEQLMNLDVTSVSRTAEPFGQAPAAIFVITQDQIRRSGASSIPEALRLADNLDVARENSHDWAISARGFNTQLANKLLVMIDGRTVYSPLFSGVFWDAQDYLLHDLDRIEVISGPGGTLWGENAVNGVINIISKNSKDTQGLYAESGGGTDLRDFIGIRYGGMISSNVYFRIYGKGFERGNQDYPNGKPANDSWRMGQGGFRMDAVPSTFDNFTLQGDIYGSELAVPTGGKGNQSGGNLLGRWSHVVSDEADMSLQVYYDRTHLYDPQNGFGMSDVIEDDLRTYDADFQYRVHLGERNQVTWGLGYRLTHDVVENAGNVAFFPPVLNRHLYNAFVQDEIKLVDNLFLTLGTKVEHNDYTGVELEPSGRLQWNVTSNHMIWSAVSRAVRTPSRIDADLREPANGSLVILAGNPHFQSEAVIAYELGYRAQLTKRVSASLSTYYNDYTDIRSVSTTPGGTPAAPGGPAIFPLYFANTLKGYTYGVELSTDYQVLDGWRIHGGYNLLEEYLRVKSGQMDLENTLNETQDPKHQVFLRSSLDLPGHIELDNQGRWVAKLFANNNGSPAIVPSYFEMDARLAWHPIPKLELAIVGQNLLHKRHAEYGVASLAAGGQEDIVRSVYGKVSWQW